MKEPSQMTILGILMQQDAERSQPDDSRRAASWQVISQAISQPAPVAGRQSGTEAIQPKTIWNPRSVFNPQSASRSSWHYPSRRLVYQAFALVLVVAVFPGRRLVFRARGLCANYPANRDHSRRHDSARRTKRRSAFRDRSAGVPADSRQHRPGRFARPVCRTPAY